MKLDLWGKLAFLTCSLTFIMSFIAYPILPDKIATHWNISGEPDQYSGRAFGAFLLPAILFGLLALLEFLPKIDPANKGAGEGFSKAYGIVKLSLALFLSGLHAFVLFFQSLGNPDIRPFMAYFMFFLFLSIGLALPKTKRNYFLGIRTPWTLESEAVWERTHAEGGRVFRFASAILFAGVFLPELFFTSIFLILGASAYLVVFSYFAFRNSRKQ